MLLFPLLAVAALSASAEPPATVDFQRDVQPIFREHCVGCHGPTQQLSGLRLDRRADAMRGGSQADIGPGNASGSRLYHRLIGTTFGLQMPPAGPLTDAQVDIIRQWIDEGAVWPDAASGETAPRAPDADAIRLIAAIRDGDRHSVDAQLQQNRDAGSRRGANGTPPLMAAALYGDAAVVQRVLAAGADPNAANNAGATALMWAVPHEDKMRALLDAGADVNARSDDRRSPLVIAAGIAGGAPAVKLLLDYGAEPSLWRTGDPSPLREAARADNPEAFRLLLPVLGFEECGHAVGNGSQNRLFHMRAARRRCGQRAAGGSATDVRHRIDRPALRPGAGSEADADWRHRRGRGGDSCGGRAQPAAAPGCRHRLHQPEWLCVLSSQQRRLDGGCCCACERLHGRPEDGEEADGRDRGLSRVVARARRPEHSDRRRCGHDELSVAWSRRGSLSARCGDRRAGDVSEAASAC